MLSIHVFTVQILAEVNETNHSFTHVMKLDQHAVIIRTLVSK